MSTWVVLPPSNQITAARMGCFRSVFTPATHARERKTHLSIPRIAPLSIELFSIPLLSIEPTYAPVTTVMTLSERREALLVEEGSSGESRVISSLRELW